jgi:hypothetical protein
MKFYAVVDTTFPDIERRILALFPVEDDALNYAITLNDHAEPRGFTGIAEVEPVQIAFNSHQDGTDLCVQCKASPQSKIAGPHYYGYELCTECWKLHEEHQNEMALKEPRNPYL